MTTLSRSSDTVAQPSAERREVRAILIEQQRSRLERQRQIEISIRLALPPR